MEPKISVIVPIYNAEIYMKRCINSILQQTHKNLELILVNDGSSDSSGKVCEEYTKKDARIKVIHKKNGGPGSARNAGLDAAGGEYIAFVDSDDYIRKDMLEILLQTIEKTQADISQCESLKVGENEEVGTQGSVSEEIKISVCSNLDALDKLYSESSLDTIVVWNKLYKATLFKDIRFAHSKIHEDEIIIYKLLYKARSAAFINLKLYYYVQTSNSIMRSKFNIKRLDCIEALEDRMTFLKEKDLKVLYLKTEAALYRYLIDMYLKVYVYIEDRNPYLQNIKQKIKGNLSNFIRNPYISKKSKLIIALMEINIKFLDFYIRYSVPKM